MASHKIREIDDMTYHNDASVAVGGDAPGMLKNVRPKLADEMSVLGEDLNLVGGRSLCHHDISRDGHNSHTVGVEQLPVPLANFPELELKISLLIEDLNAVVIGVGNDDLVFLSNSNCKGKMKHDNLFVKL